jgi:hypothetical protein
MIPSMALIPSCPVEESSDDTVTVEKGAILELATLGFTVTWQEPLAVPPRPSLTATVMVKTVWVIT